MQTSSRKQGKPEVPERIRLLYATSKTNVGTDVYAHITCYRQTYPDAGWQPVRASSPFVIARQYGHQVARPGSVYQLIKDFDQLYEKTRVSIRRGTAKLEKLSSHARPAVYQEYEREITNSLILMSCLARNLFHLFPDLTNDYKVPVFDYDNQQLNEMIRTKDLLDLFVHNRYMNLHNEYIADLFSGKPPKGSPISEKFMGYRFKVFDFGRSMHEAIRSITLKHLISELRRGMKVLDADTPHHEMVFLILNVHSFSDLLGATIPSKDYNFMMDLLFDNAEPDVAHSACGNSSTQTVFFREPRVTIAPEMSTKRLQIAVDCHVAENAPRMVGSKHLKRRTVEVGYAEFLGAVNEAFGTGSLLDLGQQMDAIRNEESKPNRQAVNSEEKRKDRTRKRHPTKKRPGRRKR